MTHAEQIQSKLLRMEATALFSQIEQAIGACTHSISDYRAYLYAPRQIEDIPVDMYVEREAHIGKPGENWWVMNLEIEGKERETELLRLLEPLRQEGYYVGTGSENLDRQMRFSLGLYGAAQMRLYISPALTMPVFQSMLRLVSMTEPLSTQQADEDDYAFDDGVLFGDWQTWK